MDTRLSCGLAVAVLLPVLMLPAFPGAAFAGGPQSSVSCGCVADPNGGASTMLPLYCTISPSGGILPHKFTEDIRCSVVVLNDLGAPIAGATVTVTPVVVGTAAFAWDPGPPPAGDPPEVPQSGITDYAGRFTATFDEGGVNHNGPPAIYPNLDLRATAELGDVGIPLPPGCFSLLNITSYDLNGDCVVNLSDLALFARQYGGGDVPRIADFNWDGRVQLTDLAMFATNYGASCASN